MSRKIRMSVSLEPDEKAVLERIAAHRGVSASSVLRELVSTSYEPLSRLAAILEAADRAQASYRQGLRQTLQETGDEVDALYREALGKLGILEDTAKGKRH